MEEWRRDGRKEVVMVDMEALVPKEHLLRKIEKVMDYEWLYLYMLQSGCFGIGMVFTVFGISECCIGLNMQDKLGACQIRSCL